MTFATTLGYTGDRTNFAFCPPGGNFGTIDAYMWTCEGKRGKVPYFSNQNVKVDGYPTGDANHDNAKFMTKERYKSRDAGTNCLDGNPDDAWMKFKDGGKIGNNCPGDKASYEVPLSVSKGKIVKYFLSYLSTFPSRLIDSCLANIKLFDFIL